jgi:hypothetical protein
MGEFRFSNKGTLLGEPYLENLVWSTLLKVLAQGEESQIGATSGYSTEAVTVGLTQVGLPGPLGNGRTIRRILFPLRPA